MLQKLKSFLGFLAAFVWPPTKAKLHRLITWIGVIFAGYAMVLVWAGQLGISTTEGKLGATVGLLTTLAAGWQRVKPKLDAAVDALPIAAGDEPGAQPEGLRGDVVTRCWIIWIILGVSALLWSPRANAEETPSPATSGAWSYGPSAAATVAAIDLRSGDYLAGAQAVALGPCFGLTYQPWVLGGDLCANIQVGKAEPNRYGASLMAHWRTYFDGGLGALFVQGDGWRLLALIGARAPFLQGGAGR